MMAKTELYLVRHGETRWTAEARMQGQQDSPLTARGIAQAQAVGRRLCSEHFDHIYSSDLQRVVDTAQPLADLLDHQIRIEPRLRERHYGIWEGLTYADMEEAHNELYQRYRTQRYEPDFLIPEAETIRQLVTRGMTIIEELAAHHKGERIAIFSHGGTLSAILRTMLGVPLGGKHAFRLTNGGISTITREAEDWQVHTVNEMAHLRAIS